MLDERFGLCWEYDKMLNERVYLEKKINDLIKKWANGEISLSNDIIEQIIKQGNIRLDELTKTKEQLYNSFREQNFEEEVKKCGSVFVAYLGDEMDPEDIRNVLIKKCPNDYFVHGFFKDGMALAKTIYDDRGENKEPFFRYNYLPLNGYNCWDDMEKVYRTFDGKYDSYLDSDKYHTIINTLYANLGVQIFKKLSDYISFCSVIYDTHNKSLVAGVTQPNGKYTHLYYGYTQNNKELMFSNDNTILTPFCNNITEMVANTYMKNGNIYTLDGELISETTVKIKRKEL